MFGMKGFHRQWSDTGPSWPSCIHMNWDQNWPHTGGPSWNQRNKDVEFICGENDSGERSRAIMPSC